MVGQVKLDTVYYNMIVCNTMHDIIYNVYLIEGHLIQES